MIGSGSSKKQENYRNRIRAIVVMPWTFLNPEQQATWQILRCRNN